MEYKDIVVFYHGNCTDGYASRHIIEGHSVPSGKVIAPEPVLCEYIPMYHDKSSDPFKAVDGFDVSNAILYIVDYSFDVETLLRLADMFRHTVVLDHHKTAQEELESLIGIRPDLEIVFDMNRSGAGITWDYLMQNISRPWWVDYVEDRDIWNNALPHTDAIGQYLRSVPYDFHAWEELNIMSADTARNLGEAMLREADAQFRRIKSMTHRMIEVAGYTVPSVNSPCYQSELGHDLCQDHPFAVMWCMNQDGQYYNSFRSTDEGVDVSEIAKLFGGGGHRNAAGAVTELPIWDYNEENNKAGELLTLASDTD